MRVAALFLILLAPQEQSIEKLLEQLQSDRVDERDHAEVELKIRGDQARSALERIAKGGDSETVARVRAILEAHAALRPITNPDLRRRLASGRAHTWTETLLEAAKKSDITREDLLPLARHGVRGANKEDQAVVSGVVAGWRLTPAAHDLVPWLEEPNWEIRRFTEDAIEACGDRSVAPALLDLSRKNRHGLGQVYLGILGRLGCREAIPDMVATFKVPQFPHEGVGEALGNLAKMDAVEILPSLLHSLRQGVGNFEVIAAVSLLAPEEILPSLREAIESDSTQIRQNAVNTLHQYYPVPAALPLLRKAAEDQNLRAAVLQAMGRIRSRDSIPDLKKCLDDPSAAIRRSAAQQLAQLGDRSGVPELLRTLNDPAAASTVMEALQRLDVREAIPVMTQHLQSPATRAAAADALARMGVREVRDTALEMLKDADAATRRSAAVTLTVLDGAKAIPRLIELLDDPDFNMAVNTAPQMLQFLKAKESAPKFLERFRKKDPNGGGGTALHYLACVSPEEARVVLIEALDGPFRAAAAESLCGLRRPEDLPLMRSLLRDRDINVRRAAAQALAGEGDASAVPELMRHPHLNQIQFNLNAVRRPEICRAWKAKILSGSPVVASTYDGLAEVCRRGGIAFEVAPDVAWLSYGNWVDIEGRDLFSIVREFAWNAGAAVIEEGKLTLLGPRTGRRFWLRWYAELYPGEGKTILADLEEGERRVAAWKRDQVAASAQPPVRLTPFLKSVPGLEEKLLKGRDEVWHKTFIESINGHGVYEGITDQDREVLAPRALRGALNAEEISAVLQQGAIRKLRTLRPLAEGYMTHAASGVRVEALHLILAFDGAKELPRAIAMLDDREPSARTGVVGVVAQLGMVDAAPELRARKDDPAIRAGLVGAAAPLGMEDMLPLLIERAKKVPNGNDDYGSRISVGFQLVILGNPSISGEVRECLKVEDHPNAIQTLLGMLASWGDRDSIPIIREMITNRRRLDEMYQDQLFRTLATLGAKEATPLILAHLQPGKFRGGAAEAAATMGLGEAIPLLRQSKAPVALASLGFLGDKESIPRLRLLLEDQNAYVRISAAQGLALLGDRASQTRILEVAREPNMDLREALSLIDSNEARQLLARRITYPTFRMYKALAPGGQDILQAMAPAIVNPDIWTRYSAAHVLGRIESAESTAELLRLLKDGYPDVRYAAAEMLCRRGLDEGVGPTYEHSLTRFAAPPFYLNGVRSREGWARLKASTITAPFYGPVKDLIAKVAAASGLALEALDEKSREYPAWTNVYVRLHSSDVPLSGLEVLERCPGSRWSVIVEADRLKILPRREAEDFWKAWRR